MRSLSTESLNGFLCVLANSIRLFRACRVAREKSSPIEYFDPFSFGADARICCLSLKKVSLAIIGLCLLSLNFPSLCTRSNCAPVKEMLNFSEQNSIILFSDAAHPSLGSSSIPKKKAS